MNQISVNVLALPRELIEWAAEWAKCHSLFMAAITLYPEWTMTEIDPSKTTSEGSPLSACAQIWLSVERFSKDGTTYLAIAASNPQRLDILLPKETKDGLRAGSIGTVSADAQSLKVWRAVLTDLKNRTLAGMWVVNPRTNEKAYYKKERYTPAVERLAQQGQKLFPLAGTNQMHIGGSPKSIT